MCAEDSILQSAVRWGEGEGRAVAALTSAPSTGCLLYPGSWPRKRMTRSRVDSGCCCSCINTYIKCGSPCLCPEWTESCFVAACIYGDWGYAPPLLYNVPPAHLLLVQYH